MVCVVFIGLLVQSEVNRALLSLYDVVTRSENPSPLNSSPKTLTGLCVGVVWNDSVDL